MATIRRRKLKWEAQIRRAGLRAFTRSFHVRKDAVIWARHMEVRADRRDLPADPKALEQIALGDLVARYRDSVSINKLSYEKERFFPKSFLTHSICAKPLSKLCAEDFAAYRDNRLKTTKPASLKRQLAPIRHLFKIARNEWGLPIRESPLDKLQLKAPDQRRERRLRDGELERLIKSANSCRNPLVAPIIQLAIETGMRRGEILAIRKGQFDLNRRTLLLTETKNGHSRIIPLTTTAIALLQARAGGKYDLLFPITANAFRLSWERLRRRAGITDLHFHDFRHEAIRRFFELGLTLPEVASISGHRDARMLFRYAHAATEQIILKLRKRDR